MGMGNVQVTPYEIEAYRTRTYTNVIHKNIIK